MVRYAFSNYNDGKIIFGISDYGNIIVLDARRSNTSTLEVDRLELNTENY